LLRSARNDGSGAPLALYIHWPFCVSKCPYCDFNSHVRDRVDQQVWRDALLADLAFQDACHQSNPRTCSRDDLRQLYEASFAS